MCTPWAAGRLSGSKIRMEIICALATTPAKHIKRDNLQTVPERLFILWCMSAVVNPNHHPFQTFSILTMGIGFVAFAGVVSVGGIETIKNIPEAWARAYDTHAGLKNINFSDNTLAAETSSIGTATVECLGDAPYSTDTVHRIGQNPNTYNVYIRKIGAGALNASSIEACIFDHTHLTTSVIEEQVK